MWAQRYILNRDDEEWGSKQLQKLYRGGEEKVSTKSNTFLFWKSTKGSLCCMRFDSWVCLYTLSWKSHIREVRHVILVLERHVLIQRGMYCYLFVFSFIICVTTYRYWLSLWFFLYKLGFCHHLWSWFFKTTTCRSFTVYNLFLCS